MGDTIILEFKDESGAVCTLHCVNPTVKEVQIIRPECHPEIRHDMLIVYTQDHSKMTFVPAITKKLIPNVTIDQYRALRDLAFDFAKDRTAKIDLLWVQEVMEEKQRTNPERYPMPYIPLLNHTC